VVRALEGAFENAVEETSAETGRLRAGSGVTDLRIEPHFRPRLVAGILSGAHAEGESHFALLGAFADGDLLRRAAAFADARGFQTHELGDSMLIMPGALAREDAVPPLVWRGTSGNAPPAASRVTAT
jgi:S-adenosylmethionine:tRNA ribosyltransferase-isomerase